MEESFKDALDSLNKVIDLSKPEYIQKLICLKNRCVELEKNMIKTSSGPNGQCMCTIFWLKHLYVMITNLNPTENYNCFF